MDQMEHSIDPFVWATTPTGTARHLQTCQHFEAKTVPKVVTPFEMQTLPICTHCRTWHRDHPHQTAGDHVALLGTLDWMKAAV